MTKVVNKYKSEYDVYIGRGSIWGNPYQMQSEADRDHVIESYRKYLWDEIKSGNISKQMLISLNGKRLGCFCSPKPCHGDVLVKAIEWAISK